MNDSDLELSNLRRDYSLAELNEGDMAVEPFTQFERWFEHAQKAKLIEPYAMILATADAKGVPSSRVVLMRGFSSKGIDFFTNYGSHKGQDLAQNPHAAILFYWAELERQVRIEGVVSKLSAEESDTYFAARPASNRIAAWASPQSQVIAGRDELDRRFGEASNAYGDIAKRPPFWGGYRLTPSNFEFWQGRQSRLHDRLAYEKSGESWQLQRLAP